MNAVSRQAVVSAEHSVACSVSHNVC